MAVKSYLEAIYIMSEIKKNKNLRVYCSLSMKLNYKLAICADLREIIWIKRKLLKRHFCTFLSGITTLCSLLDMKLIWTYQFSNCLKIRTHLVNSSDGNLMISTA